MAKYRLTEDQLQKIFENLEMSKMNEMDNYNYPAGSDTSDAPWNREEPPTSRGISSNGVYELVGSDRLQFLLINKQTSELYFTIGDVWETDSGGRWSDIKDYLHAFLDVRQEPDSSEDGTHMVSSDDWKDHIGDEEIGDALANYMNYFSSKGRDLGIVDTESWEDGDGKFLLVKPDNVDEQIYSEKLNTKAHQLLGSPLEIN